MELVTMIAVGKWDDRGNLDFVPCNERVNGKRYNAFGVQISAAGDPAAVRRPYKIEEVGTTTYVMYDDDTLTDVPIFKTTEI
jgi:hypothetical protein